MMDTSLQIPTITMDLNLFRGGLYFWVRPSTDQILYIGKTVNFLSRFNCHHIISPDRIHPGDEIRLLFVDDRVRRDKLEVEYIRHYKPIYNTKDNPVPRYQQLPPPLVSLPLMVPVPDIIPEPYPTITISELGLLLSVRDSDIRKMMETGKIRADAAMVTRYGGIPVSALPEYMRSLAMVLT